MPLVLSRRLAARSAFRPLAMAEEYAKLQPLKESSRGHQL
jgi:hypothetical protein